MIKVRKLSAGYGHKQIIEDLSFQANSSEFIGLLGVNGSGKTTLLKALAGLIAPHAGQIMLADKPLNLLKPKARARQIAFLPQGDINSWDMSVKQIVELGRAPYRGPLGRLSDQGHNAVRKALQITQSEALAHRNINSLSGGERRRVLLARALAVRAPLLLADEPIAALDPYYQISMMHILARQAVNGGLIITALHDLSLARQFCTRLIVLHDGGIAADGPPDEVLNDRLLKDVFAIRRKSDGRYYISA